MPIKLGPYYLAEQRKRQRIFGAKVLGFALAGGLSVGAVAALGSNGGLDAAASYAREVAVSHELIRANTPPPGAYYPGCNAARAAGVAPLYAGEPGYRPEMDGDGDGIACEPYRGH
jgi:hypothetical protein